MGVGPPPMAIYIESVRAPVREACERSLRRLPFIVLEGVVIRLPGLVLDAL